MMSRTWSFDKHFEGLKKRQTVFRLYLKACLYESDYTDVAVNDKNEVLGYIFGGPTRLNPMQTVKQASLGFNIIKGDLGNIRWAYKVMKNYQKDLECLMRNKDYFDGEVKLFFVDERMRGTGLGKKLMNRFIDHCRRRDMKEIVLMTDMGCNFGFYEHYGFKRLKEIHSNLFARPEADVNGFSYSYKIS